MEKNNYYNELILKLKHTLMEKDFDYYKDLIKKNKLPEGFGQWLMTNEVGNTLAHIAVWNKILPPDWTDKTEDWLIKDKNGDTIAHDAAQKGILPLTWTNDEDNWKTTNLNHKYTVGFLYSNHHKEHYNNPKNLEDYCQNIKDHLYPRIENKHEFYSDEINNLNNFLDPFLKCIYETSQKEWMQTSDQYSSFLIDYVESIMNYIQDHLRFFDNIQGNALILLNKTKENFNKTSQHLQNEKIKIKEHLFKHHESKNQSIINEKEHEHESDFSDTL